jgi:hypothetical protein
MRKKVLIAVISTLISILIFCCCLNGLLDKTQSRNEAIISSEAEAKQFVSSAINKLYPGQFQQYSITMSFNEEKGIWRGYTYKTNGAEMISRGMPIIEFTSKGWLLSYGLSRD